MSPQRRNTPHHSLPRAWWALPGSAWLGSKNHARPQMSVFALLADVLASLLSGCEGAAWSAGGAF